MSAPAKLLIGLLGVALLTWLWLQPFGYAASIADELEQSAIESLAAQGAENVEALVPRDPVRRTVELSGELPNEDRAALRESVLALNGVGNAIWSEPDSAELEQIAAAETSAAEECRGELTSVSDSHQITFRSGSPYVNSESQRLLDRLAEVARGCSGVRIEISGHSNGGGRPNVNMEMSAFRATTVRDALVERGVPAEMLTTIGKGSSEPLGDNPADAVNRRVDFTVIVVNGEAD